MSILERYIGQYVEITIDPRTLPESRNKHGPWGYIGKLVEIDSQFLLLSPFEVYRPEAPGLGGREPITSKRIVSYLKEIEAKREGNVVELSDRIQPTDDLDPAPQFRKLLREANNEKVVPLSTICGFEQYKEY